MATMTSRLLGGDWPVVVLMGTATATTLAMVFVIVAVLVSGGWGTLSLGFLIEPPRDGMTAGGVFPAIVGTVLLVLVMSLAAVPLGTATAFYLHEYAGIHPRRIALFRQVIRALAGVPAIVFGLFGLAFFVQFVGGGLDSLGRERIGPHWGQPNLLWAGLTMALLTLPVVIVTVEESLRAVPREMREASLALGASKFTTVCSVVFPQALPGILTGAILAVSRGAGEVAPIMFTGAAYYVPELPRALTDQFMELGYHLYVMATQSTDVEATAGIQHATALVLLFLTGALNLSAIFLRARFRARHWS
jgi:phosphate transport system permease protein